MIHGHTGSAAVQQVQILQGAMSTGSGKTLYIIIPLRDLNYKYMFTKLNNLLNFYRKEGGNSCKTATDLEENFRDHSLRVPDYSRISIVS